MVLLPLQSETDVCLMSAVVGLGPMYFYLYIILNNQKHDFSACEFV